MIHCGKTGSTPTPTPNPPTPVATIPTVTTTAISAITQSTATGGGNVTFDGNSTILGRGICWSSVNQVPTKTDTLTGDGTGTGTYTSSLSNLVADRKYYVRAYATNSIGTAYGDVVTFNTGKQVVLPTVTTANATNITDSTAITGGNITSTGNATLYTYGVCWSSTNQTPTTNDFKQAVTGTGTGNFSDTLTGLWAATVYYVRSYVTNSAGTAYGSVITFTTPTVYTFGQSYGGGLVAYLDYTGRHGFVVTSTDLNGANGLTWDATPLVNGTYTYTPTGATHTEIGTGGANTAVIYGIYKSGNYAASVCVNYRGGNYTDWVLPSKDELNQIYRNKTALGIPNTANYWWSSSEYSYQSAYSQLFSIGASNIDAKFAGRVVRAIRYF